MTEAVESFLKPSGWFVLVELPRPETKTAGGLYKAQETIDAEQLGAITGRVIALGPDCFQDKAKFPSGPRCKVGDFIVMRAYAGSRVRVDGQEFRLISDTSVEATTTKPDALSKI